jgi:hypothetical protein
LGSRPVEWIPSIHSNISKELYMNKRLLVPWTAVFVLGASLGLWGHQPSPVDVSVESILARRGDSFLRLTNNTRESQSLTFSAGPAGTATFRGVREIVLSPNAAMGVNLGDLQLEDGIQILHVISTVAVPGGGTAPGPELHEVLDVDRTGVSKTTYERAFLSRRNVISGRSVPLNVDIGGGHIDAQPIGALAFDSAIVSDDTAVERVDALSTFEMSNMRLRELPEPGDAVGDGVFARRASIDAFQFARRDDAAPRREVGPFGTIKGKFTVKIPGPNGGAAIYQAAWGWKVRAWQNLGGTWFQVASASVASDGNWSADYVIPPFAGLQVRVEYPPANRFMQVQDANENIYTWGDDWNMTGSITNIGFRSANLTKTGNAPGIDKIYQGGMALWRKFNKYGMNALRDVPMELTYPNTLATGNCTSQSNGNTIAWSCSQSDDGKIWLIPAHAVAGVVQHELAHSIHSFYWDGNMPAGGGIQHNLTKCYNPGLALTEGFADFMPYWVQFDPTAVNPVESQLGLKIDTLGSGFCTGSSNESRVAATFWDVYDSVQDGTSPIKDTWNFSKPYAPVSTFLNNPNHNSMFEYMSVYTTILGNNMAVPIVQLFQLNTTIFP